MSRSIAPAVALALALARAALGDSLTASARVEPAPLSVGDRATLTIVVSCTLDSAPGPIGTPEITLPDVPQLGLTADAPPSGQSVRTTVSREGIVLDATFEYLLLPSEAGALDLPPVTVEVTIGSRQLSAQTAPLRLVVSGGDQGRGWASRPQSVTAGRPIERAPWLALIGGLMLAGGAGLTAALIFALSLRRRTDAKSAGIGAAESRATVAELGRLAAMGDGSAFYTQARHVLALALGGVQGTATSAELVSRAATAGASPGAVESLAAVLENADHVVYGGAQVTVPQLEVDRDRLLAVLAELSDRMRA